MCTQKSDGTFYLSANDAITADRLIGGFSLWF